jgi:hypothetical protein
MDFGSNAEEIDSGPLRELAARALLGMFKPSCHATKLEQPGLVWCPAVG